MHYPHSELPLWPDWLEKERVPEELLAQAYEDTPAPWRAALKTGLALAHFYYGDCDSLQNIEKINPRFGFRQNLASQPVAWAMFCMATRLDAPARLCAALALPLLAGVKNVFAVFLAHQPSAHDLLALELCGIEDCFYVPSLPRHEQLLEHLSAYAPGAGHIFFFADQQNTAPICQAGKLDLIHYSEIHRPKLLMLEPKLFDMGLLEFLHGFTPETDEAAARRWDCVYAGDSVPHDSNRLKTRLVLTPACEGFWNWSGISPDSYMSRLATLRTLETPED